MVQDPGAGTVVASPVGHGVTTEAAEGEETTRPNEVDARQPVSAIQLNFKDLVGWIRSIRIVDCEVIGPALDPEVIAAGDDRLRGPQGHAAVGR